MIASFFQHLEAASARYLLISGQATILYGAASFSEDVDLWVDPDRNNLEAFLGVLRQSRARYYKLTPPLTEAHARRGHGFHFVLPGESGDSETYLDVLGRPPRVGSYESALADARTFDTDWGRIPTIGIRPLVEVKKTQRAEDYPVISRLVLRLLEDTTPDAAALRWALENLMTVGALAELFRTHDAALDAHRLPLAELLTRHRDELRGGSTLSESAEDEIDAWLGERIAKHRKADRRYWRPIIDELRELRRAGQLMPEGTAV